MAMLPSAAVFGLVAVPPMAGDRVHKKRGRQVSVARVLIGAGLAALAAAGTYLAVRDRVVSANGAPPAHPVPVTAGTVEEKAFPIYRVGLGTVQAYNTVTVKVRVDGEVQNIAFREGQDVREGDLLAQIDPRPLCGAT